MPPLIEKWNQLRDTDKDLFPLLEVGNVPVLLLKVLNVSGYITLHESYLEWLKYKTATPLLYTVYRTRNRKQLGRK